MNKILIILSILLLQGCAITHVYGPYSGKVLNKETNDPIPGVGVFITFHTESPTVGGPVGSTIGAIEGITNENGEFLIPAKRLYTFRVFSFWPDECIPHFFKPGFGAYPQHPGSESNLRTISKSWMFGETGAKIIIKLPKLHSFSERKNNHFSLYGDGSDLYLYAQYIDQERVELGYEPYELDNYSRKKGLIDKDKKTILDYYHPFFYGHGHSEDILEKNKNYKPYENMNEIVPTHKGLKDIRKGLWPYVWEYSNNPIKYRQPYMSYPIGFIQPRMFFINTKYGDDFIFLLKKNNVPYSLNTNPDFIGYDIIWDYEYNDKVELIKLEFHRNIINKEYSSF